MKILWPNVFLLAVVCLTFFGCSQQRPAIPTSTVPTANNAIDPAPMLLPVKVSGKWGYVNSSGQLVINPQFDYAREFREGRAPICVGTYCNLVAMNREAPGSLPANFFSTPAPVWGFIDPSGKAVVTPQYKDAHDFSEGLAPVCTKSSSCGYIDRDGKVAIPLQFGLARSFSEGLAAACVGKCLGDGKFGFIDHSGHFVVNPQYDSVSAFKNGFAQVVLGKGHDAKTGYIDKTGKTVWQPSN